VRVLVGFPIALVLTALLPTSLTTACGGASSAEANPKIAFTSDRDGNREIHVMNADGSGQRRLTRNPAEDVSPSWSPDGRTIGFTSDRDGNFEIYAMNADGSGQRRLTRNPADDGLPAWSPDGRTIAFPSDRDGNFEIYAMNADGSGQRNLTRNPAGDFLFAAWSPDGRRIAFTSDRDGRCDTQLCPANFEIYVMNADGSGQRRLTRNSAEDVSPVWSPHEPNE